MLVQTQWQADTRTGHHANIRTLKMTPEIRIKVDIYAEGSTKETPRERVASPTGEGKDVKETRMLSDGQKKNSKILYVPWFVYENGNQVVSTSCMKP